ncbi:hypothetical protein HGRIS_001750 [Hohenbuehelia grisea]|uniref:DUF6534 domain-containing protein n=1 Tax=Hohenbuehelia grisea TaxID=104357 RepID=A0ABR3JK40_9AGAR
MSSVDVHRTFGAVLLGGLFALGLSGIVTIQVLIYFKLYPDDHSRLKALVLGIWLLDICHSSFVVTAVWSYLIKNYGNSATIDHIPWSIPMTIVFTAVLTFCVHCFFANRVFMLSRRNYYLTLPILILAVCRLTSACVTTGTMLHEGTLTGFKRDYKFVFTLGLALSSAVDILITGLLLFLLQTKRTGLSNLDNIIDSLILYAFETGSLTCAATVASMICWLTMNDNLWVPTSSASFIKTSRTFRIFMGLHFVISKLYANSLLVTLNTRAKLRRARSGSENNNLVVLGARRPTHSRDQLSGDQRTPPKVDSQQPVLQISVEKSVQYMSDDDRSTPTPTHHWN